MKKTTIKDFFSKEVIKKIVFAFVFFLLIESVFEITNFFFTIHKTKKNYYLKQKNVIKEQVNHFIDYIHKKHHAEKIELINRTEKDIEHIAAHLFIVNEYVQYSKDDIYQQTVQSFLEKHPDRIFIIYHPGKKKYYTKNILPDSLKENIFLKLKKNPDIYKSFSLDNETDFIGFYNTKLNLIIGESTDYKNFIKNLKKQILTDLEIINFEYNGYIFIDDFDYNCIRHANKNYIGKNVFNNQDAMGFFINQELYNMGQRENGGFIEYYDTTGNFDRGITKKYTFVSSYKPFRWTIGSGVYTSDLDKTLNIEKDSLRKKLIIQIIFFILFTSILLLLSIRISISTVKIINYHFDILLQKIKQSISKNEAIDYNSLSLHEFIEFSISVNYIIKQWQKNQIFFRESENRLRTLLDNIPDIVVFKDDKNLWLEANKETLRLFHLDPYAYKYRSNKEIVDFLKSNKQKFLEFEKLEKNIIKNQRGHRQEFIFHIDDQEKIYDIIWTPIISQENTHQGLVIIGRDITEMKQLSHEMMHLVKMESLGLIAGGIAHDFNNTLMVIQGNLSILNNKNPNMSTDIKSIVEHMDKSIAKGKYLANYLLTFSKGGQPVKKPVLIQNILEEALSFSLAGSSFEYKLINKNSNEFVLGDENQLVQVMSSIIFNAKDSMPQGGIITAEIISNNDIVTIKIIDKGIGIPEKNLNKIFDPFYTTKPKSLGLGLSTSYSIIKQHKGSIKIESIENKGTSVYIEFPKLYINNDKKNKLMKNQSFKILVMDDDKDILDVINEYLSNLGHVIELAKDGEIAIRKYSEALKTDRPFDLVILDLTVAGGMGGKDCMIQLIKLDPNIKAVASSGYSNDEVMSHFQKYGFFDILPKPYTLDAINQIIQKL